MGFSSVAIVAGVAALTTSLFKDEELRVKDVIEFSKIDKKSIENHPQLKIVKNDINTHITGIKDPTYHEILIEIMSTYNKPVGYFNKLDGRLQYSEPYQISIVSPGLLARFKNAMTDINSGLATFIYLSFLLISLTLAIELDASSVTSMQAAAIILAGLNGVIFSHLLIGLSVQWRKSAHKVKEAEYENLFNEYKNKKIKLMELSTDKLMEEE
ncbi:hypothetical protein QMZ93_02285 [Pantoea stewartii subsp. indologenes]|uniref:hypothetical protein n=1 Tax=Pantoea stewartii TaxID=66269 RepID=UPI0019822375|nr:hypothetical protein [Pantoea stewartii]MDK2632178.1 hypothetical protein [Pantoea stewartii subsp. indologenes]